MYSAGNICSLSEGCRCRAAKFLQDTQNEPHDIVCHMRRANFRRDAGKEAFNVLTTRSSFQVPGP